MFGFIKTFATAVSSSWSNPSDDKDVLDLNAAPIDLLESSWKLAQEQHERLLRSTSFDESGSVLRDSRLPKSLDAMVQALIRESDALVAAAIHTQQHSAQEHTDIASAGMPAVNRYTVFREGECIEYLLEHRVIEKLCGIGAVDKPPGMMALILLTIKELIGVHPSVLLPSESLHRPLRQLTTACIAHRREASGGGTPSAHRATALTPFPTSGSGGGSTAGRKAQSSTSTAVARRGGLSSEVVSPLVSDDESEASARARARDAEYPNETATAAAPTTRAGVAALEDVDAELTRSSSTGSMRGGDEVKVMRYVKATPAQRMLAQLAHSIWCAIAQIPSLLSCFYSERLLERRRYQELLILEALTPWIYGEGNAHSRPNFVDISREGVLIALSLRDPRIVRYVMNKTGIISQLALRAAEAFEKYVAVSSRQRAHARGESSSITATPPAPVPEDDVSVAGHALKLTVERLSYINAILLVTAAPRTVLAARAEQAEAHAVGSGGLNSTGHAGAVTGEVAPAAGEGVQGGSHEQVGGESSLAVVAASLDTGDTAILSASLMHEAAKYICQETLVPALLSTSDSQQEAATICLATILRQLHLQAPPATLGDSTCTPIVDLLTAAVVGISPPAEFVASTIPLAACFSSPAVRDALAARVSAAASSRANKATLYLLNVLFETGSEAVRRHLLTSPSGSSHASSAIPLSLDSSSSCLVAIAPLTGDEEDASSNMTYHVRHDSVTALWRQLHQAAIAGVDDAAQTCSKATTQPTHIGASGSGSGSGSDTVLHHHHVSFAEWMLVASAAAAREAAAAAHAAGDPTSASPMPPGHSTAARRLSLGARLSTLQAQLRSPGRRRSSVDKHGTPSPQASILASDAEILVFTHGWSGFDAHLHTSASGDYVVEAARQIMESQQRGRSGRNESAPPLAASTAATTGSLPGSTGTATPPSLLDALVQRLRDVLGRELDLDTFSLLTACIMSIARSTTSAHLLVRLFSSAPPPPGSEATTSTASLTASADVKASPAPASSISLSLVDVLVQVWREFHRRFALVGGHANTVCEAISHRKRELRAGEHAHDGSLSARSKHAALSSEAQALVETRGALLDAYVRFQEFVHEVAASLEAAACMEAEYS